jgi:hypothetical protein
VDVGAQLTAEVLMITPRREGVTNYIGWTAFCEGCISLGKVYCEVFTVIFSTFEVFVINCGCCSRACPLYQE